MTVTLLVILLLIALNGLLAMSELAIVTAREARLKVMADRGDRGAKAALELAADPGRLLSSVQIGITLVGVLAGAFSGATLGAGLAAALERAGLGAAMADALGVGLVVVAITYLSLVFGELVPKQIALRAPEVWAARAARPLSLVAVAAAPFVWLLDVSSKAVLFVLGQSGPADRGVTDEEVRTVLADARTSGLMEPAETDMIAGVMRIADRTAKGVMVPRLDVHTVDMSEGAETVMRRFAATGHSRMPVRDGGEDDVVGILRARDVLAAQADGRELDLRSLMVEAPVIPDGMPVLDLLESLKRAPAHMVLVFDEYGHFEGLVTPMDLLQAIAGEFPEGGASEPKIVEREAGGYLVAGWMPVDEFADLIGLPLDPDREYETVAGLVLDRSDSLPGVGDHVRIEGWDFEVVDLDGRRIDKLLVRRV
ncbi:MAG: hemolysin family protein [Oceanicaulis sp.]